MQSISGTLKYSELKRGSKIAANWEKSIMEVKVSIIEGNKTKKFQAYVCMLPKPLQTYS